MKYNKKFLIMFVIILLLISLTGCSNIPNISDIQSNSNQTETDTSVSNSTAGQTESTKGTETSDYKNDFTLKDLDGNEVSLSDFAGSIVVLNFWATWCPPCKAEIPDFVEVSSSYKDKGVSFIGVSLDEDFNALVNFVSEYKISYTIVVDSNSVNVANDWGINAIPTTFFLDENGNILDSVIGQIPKETLITKIESFLSRD